MTTFLPISMVPWGSSRHCCHCLTHPGSTANVDSANGCANKNLGVQKFGISFTSGQLMYHRRGNPLNLSVLKSIHMVDPPNSSTSKATSANSILGTATTTNVLAAVWAAKPRSKAVPAALPEGFVQPTPNTTPFHYAFATGSQRIACACCLFCVARTFAGVPLNHLKAAL